MSQLEPGLRVVERPGSYLRRAFLTGLGITLPVLVTVVALVFVVDFLTGLLNPAVVLIQGTVGSTQRLPDVVIAGIAMVVLLFLMLLVGLVAESSYGGGVEARMEAVMASLPALGSVYTSIDELSEMLLDSDTESFREVKVVEYPHEGTYALAFLTAESAEAVSEVTDHGRMVTVFMPMAPNPMGGFLMHVPDDRVYDVDMSVEEGVQAVLSTGVALERPPAVDADERPGNGGDGARGGGPTGAGEA